MTDLSQAMTAKYRQDYRAPFYWCDSIDLDFQLQEVVGTVANAGHQIVRLSYQPRRVVTAVGEIVVEQGEVAVAFIEGFLDPLFEILGNALPVGEIRPANA